VTLTGEGPHGRECGRGRRGRRAHRRCPVGVPEGV